MKTKFATVLGAVGLIGVACWLLRPPEGRPARQITNGPAPASSVVAAQSLPAPKKSATEVAPPVDPIKVPARIRPVVDVRGEYWSRLATVHALANDLKPQELSPLYDFLRTGEIGDEKTRGGEHVLKNDLVSVLRQQADPPAGLTRLLIELSRDPAQDAVMRGYALQHLQVWYSQLVDKDFPIVVPEQERSEIRQAFWDALKDPDPTVAGTALLSLHRLAEVHSEFDQGQIAATALKFSQEDSYGALARSTALQICAERKLEEALPTALALARQADGIPLKISAIAALGMLGGPDQIGFLEQLAEGENERLQLPAKAALKQIQQRRVN